MTENRQEPRPIRLLVNIDVPDLAEGERFYTEALPLRVGRRLGPDFLELLGLEVPIYLLVKAAGRAHRTTPRRPAATTGIGLRSISISSSTTLKRRSSARPGPALSSRGRSPITRTESSPSSPIRSATASACSS